MTETVFNNKKIDFLKQPMFFGKKGMNTQRFDVLRYPIFDKLTQTQLSFFWRPEEVNLQKDRADFKKLTEGQQFIFTRNLLYQTLLDSVQGRSPGLAFLPFVTLPELETCITTWEFFETLHSRSYTHIIRNLYANPTEVFDSLLDDKEIVLRAKSVTKYYDEFIEYGLMHRTGGFTTTLKELKKKFYLALISVNILEGIRFYVSFACTFAFTEGLKVMEGSSKIVSLISRDESQHLAITQNIINNYRKHEGDKEMIKIMADCEDEVYKMYEEAVNEEKRWAKYLFDGRSLLGLNDQILGDYVEYMANKRMRTIGLKQMYSQPTNPLSWTEHWLSSKNNQNAPQETEIESYLIGAVNQDVNENDFDNIKL